MNEPHTEPISKHERTFLFFVGSAEGDATKKGRFLNMNLIERAEFFQGGEMRVTTASGATFVFQQPDAALIINLLASRSVEANGEPIKLPAIDESPAEHPKSKL